MCRQKNCHGGVIFSDTSDVEINTCTFVNNFIVGIDKYSFDGALGSFVSNIVINLSFFINNTASYGGAVHFRHCDVIVHEVNFVANTAIRKGGAAFIEGCQHVCVTKSGYTQNSALEYGGAIWTKASHLYILNSQFTRNGANFSGGALFSVKSTITINMSMFVSNKAHSGGALLIIYSSVKCMGNTDLMKNIATLGAFVFSHSTGHIMGALSVRQNIGSLLVFSSIVRTEAEIDVSDNVPMKNASSVLQGGGITSIFSNIVLFGTNKLVHNSAISGGGILAKSSNIFMSGNSTISNNTANTGGGICLYHSEIVFEGFTALSNNKARNRGGGIHSVSSSIMLRTIHKLNYLHLISNTAKQGGGLCLEASSKFHFVTKNEQVIFFIKNSAEKGGAIYVADDTNSGTCLSSKDNEIDISESECFFQPVKETPDKHYPSVILEKYIDFSHNAALLSGAILFGGLLDRCTINSCKYSNQPDFIDFILNDTTSDAVRLCLCHHNQKDCSRHHEPIRIRKGQTFSISAVSVDQVNHTLNATIIGYLNNTESNNGKRSLGIGQRAQIARSSCTDLTYQVYSPLDKEKLILFAVGPCKNVGISKQIIDIYFLPCTCPLGFKPSKGKVTMCECVCDSELHPFITKCNASSALIIRDRDIWITAIDNFTDILVYPHCPFDYCFPPTSPVSINLSSPNGADAQCTFNRSGLLCGTCQQGLSLSLGTSHCVPCPHYWLKLSITITIGAILAGIVMVAFLLMFKMTIAVGTVNGLVFFANIIHANKSIFIPFHRPNFFTVFIAWLNLDFGFDTCYFKGMDAYAKSWIEFAFPCYVILLVLLVIKISQHSTTFSELIGTRNPVATLTTLILLAYAKVLQNIIIVTSFAVLKYPNGTHELVWRPDATVHYLQGKHLPLFLAAVVILILGVIYTFLLFSWQ